MLPSWRVFARASEVDVTQRDDECCIKQRPCRPMLPQRCYIGGGIRRVQKSFIVMTVTVRRTLYVSAQMRGSESHRSNVADVAWMRFHCNHSMGDAGLKSENKTKIIRQAAAMQLSLCVR